MLVKVLPLMGLLLVMNDRILMGTGASSLKNNDVSENITLIQALNRLDRYGMAQLHYAIEKGDRAEVSSLLEQGADVNLQDNEGKPPLHQAIEKGHYEIVTLLLDSGAKIDLKDHIYNYSMTPLHYAAAYNRDSIVSLLLDNGANINLKNQCGVTPLHTAAINCHDSIVNLLLSQSADVYIQDDEGRTPLHYAVLVDHNRIVDRLVKKAKTEDKQEDIVNIQDNEGQTPLHTAVQFAPIRSQTIALLVSYGADKGIRDNKNQTPQSIINKALSEEFILAQYSRIDSSASQQESSSLMQQIFSSEELSTDKERLELVTAMFEDPTLSNKLVQHICPSGRSTKNARIK